jgi:hypothetical protein
MKKYTNYLNNIEVSDEQHDTLITNLIKPAKIQKMRIFPLYAGLATAALLCAVAIPFAMTSGERGEFIDQTTPIVLSNVQTNIDDPTTALTPENNDEVLKTNAQYPSTNPPAPSTNAPEVTTARNNPAQTISLPPLSGLPANDFKLSDIPQNTNGGTSSCMSPPKTKLQELFLQNDRQQGFAFVRVTNTKVTEKPNPHYQEGVMTSLGKPPKTFITQESTLQLISTLWSNTAIPATMTVTQTIHGYGGRVSNALRQDGVYLLPLWNFEGAWYMDSEWDVLFEVDNNGNIWSHSDGEGFKKFDGKPAQDLANAITSLTSDSVFEYAISPFGRTTEWGYALAEVTVNSVRQTNNEWGGSFQAYGLTVDKMHLPSQERTKLQLGNTTAISYHRGSFEVGNRYLTFLWHDGSSFNLEPSYSAIINSDGKLSQIPAPAWDIVDENGDEVDMYADYEWQTVFHGLYGYTIAQLADIAARSFEWHNR